MTDAVVLGRPVHHPSAEFQYPKQVLEKAEHPSAVELIALWENHRAAGGMRMGRDIPSRALAKFLPNIVISDPIGDWEDAHIRLAGTVYTERFGCDISGMLLRDIYKADPAGGRLLLEAGKYSGISGKPVVVSTRVMAGTSVYLHFEVVILPIFAPDGVRLWSMVGTFRHADR